MPSGRIDLRLENIGQVGQSQFSVDILTNGLAPPQATIIGRVAYPPITEIFADPRTVEGSFGHYNVIRLSLVFSSPIPSSAQYIAVSLFQEDATQFTFPWFGLMLEKAISGQATPTSHPVS
jgi:hypothetical protein